MPIVLHKQGRTLIRLSLDRALTSVGRGPTTDGAGLPAQGVLAEDLVLTAVHAILEEARWRSRLRLNLLLRSLLVHRLFLGDGLVQPFEIVSPKLELGHVSLRDCGL
jgi:hypothetical protein